MKSKLLILLILLPFQQLFAQVSAGGGGGGGGSSSMEIPIEVLYSPGVSYSETETSSGSVSTFIGNAFGARLGLSFGMMQILGSFENSTQDNEIVVDGTSQSKSNTEIGAVLKLNFDSLYLGASYHMVDTTLTNSGASTTESELSGSKITALLGYSLNLMGNFKVFAEGSYILSGEYTSVDGANLANPIVITGLGATIGMGLSF